MLLLQVNNQQGLKSARKLSFAQEVMSSFYRVYKLQILNLTTKISFKCAPHYERPHVNVTVCKFGYDWAPPMVLPLLITFWKLKLLTLLWSKCFPKTVSATICRVCNSNCGSQNLFILIYSVFPLNYLVWNISTLFFRYYHYILYNLSKVPPQITTIITEIFNIHIII